MPSTCPNSDGSITTVSDGGDIANGLAIAWKPIFAEKHIPIEDARNYLSTFGGQWDWSLSSRPILEKVEDVLRSLPNTASGPDGLPYAAWKYGGDEATKTLWLITNAQCDGDLPPSNFNESATIFIPKGEFEADAISIAGAPLETRPLAFKNADNKICAAIVNNAIRETVTQGTHFSQNGFVPGRQLIQNPVDLDTAGRSYALIADDKNQCQISKSSAASIVREPLQEDAPQGNRSLQDGSGYGESKIHEF